MKVKKRYLLIPLLVLGLILSISPFIFRVNANSFEYAKSFIDIDINDTSNYTWFAVFSVNYKQITDNNSYRFIKQSYDEGQQHVDVITFISRNSSDTDFIIDNTNINIYGQEWYFFTYSNSNKRIIIWHLHITDFENGVFAVDESTLIYSNPQVYNELADWYSGQLGDYSNKMLTIYGQTIQKGYDINSNYNNTNLSYINALLSTYCQTPILGEIGGNAYRNGVNDGYITGYDVGYSAGQTGENAITPFFNVMTGVFTVVDTILQIELVPHVKLWYFIALPLFFLILWAVLKIWKHN